MDVGRWSWAATHFCRVAATEFSRGFEPTDRGFTHDGFQPTEFLPRQRQLNLAVGLNPRIAVPPNRPRRVSDG